MSRDATPAPMSESEYRSISSFIEREFGIRMPPIKKALLQGRLHKRLDACGFGSYREYFEFVTDDPEGRDEFLHFIDLVSTHETSFWREPSHFKHLRVAVPSLYERGRTMLALSAACSTGEEAYSMAMTMDDALSGAGAGDMPFRVEGFDLSARAAEMAARGVYEERRVTGKVPPSLVSRYFMRSRKPGESLYRVVPELRARASFHTGNLLDDMGLAERLYDVIFCRNVLIYFDRKLQEKTVRRLIERLAPGGYLYLGHSETMSSLDLPLRAVTHAIYQLD